METKPTDSHAGLEEINPSKPLHQEMSSYSWGKAPHLEIIVCDVKNRNFIVKPPGQQVNIFFGEQYWVKHSEVRTKLSQVVPFHFLFENY